MRPLVSICVPTYNGSEYLVECLQSAQAQTLEDTEILVIDDASSDDSVSVVRDFARGDSRVRVEINQRNLGMVGNWNRCVQLARGKWIKFVFQDDLLDPSCLELMVAAGEEGFPIVACSRRLDNSTSRSLEFEHIARAAVRSSVSSLYPGKSEITAGEICGRVIREPSVNFIGEPTAVLLERELFERYGGFDPALVQLCDWEFCLRASVHHGLAYVPESLATFRLHGDGTTARNREHRLYALRELDPLVVRYVLCFSRAFRPVQRAALRRFPPGEMYARLVVRAHRVRSHALAETNADPPKTELLREWGRVAAAYPGLARLTTRPTVALAALIERLGPGKWT